MGRRAQNPKFSKVKHETKVEISDGWVGESNQKPNTANVTNVTNDKKIILYSRQFLKDSVTKLFQSKYSLTNQVWYLSL